jgi:trigger factor
MRQEAMRYGQQAQQVFDLLRDNPNAQAQLRAPIFEEKVVDLLFGRAKVADKPATKDELMAEDDLPEGYGEAKPAVKAAKPAKAKAKKAEAPAEAEAPPPAAAEAAPAPKKKAAKPKPEDAVEAAAEPAPAKAKRAAKAKPE